ncbi:MAG: CARDB domain-containing protein [Propionibacteriaceae bacterium]
MSRIVRRLFVLLAGIAVVLSGLVLAADPAAARPNCDGPHPPPICDPDPPEPAPRYPDLVATVSGPGSAVGGTTVSYVITVTNPSGRNAAAVGGVALNASLTSAATAAATNATGGFVCTRSAGNVSCTGGYLSIGGSATVTVTAVLPSTATTVTTTATVDPANVIVERSEANNTAATSTAVATPALPDLTMAMTGPSTVRGIYAAGIWTMTITNQGAAPASIVNVQWLTNWGGNVNANAVKSGAIGFTCTPPPEYLQQLVYCYGNATLAPGASATIVITAVPPGSDNVYGPYGQSTVTATVDYATQVQESNESNNQATVTSVITS